MREVGDGNLNLVFVVTGKAPDGDVASLVVKQALPYVRADPSWPMSPARNHAEARASADPREAEPGSRPSRSTTSTRSGMRSRSRTCPTIGSGAVRSTTASATPTRRRRSGDTSPTSRSATSAFGVDAEQLKPLVAEAINPPLCKITELLVFSEPYTAGGHGTVPPASRADVAAYADDPDVIAAIGAAKWNFMTRAEALIHGDLHTGSVMVRDDR